MSFSNILTSVLLLSSAIVASAGVTQKDFTGIGHIHVLKSDDWRKATPAQKVGCLDDQGLFIKDDSPNDCAVFSRLNVFPYTLSSQSGNCTFEDEHTPANTDSAYGKKDHAWTCNATYVANIYDELYTVDGFSYTFLCFGDVACYYDAKALPESSSDRVPLWQYRWGSQQKGITPGHVQLQLLWDKIDDSSKGEDAEAIPGPRVELSAGIQVPLAGRALRV
ncbi:hypothetical protein K504DRAFT_475722 [Pleomassaria siparia CBS 279.74]|uniref:Ecp2 effector protein domain-containing protein n=1 Tax=Pleomassaria siparia CBS 279.74 TaxID=1314801 RepID=A0A6G1KE06_9PLEO|nr:hypothetical protein K504DRAFT_475722 [Pleomassaria siparia CBS 279.74]